MLVPVVIVYVLASRKSVEIRCMGSMVCQCDFISSTAHLYLAEIFINSNLVFFFFSSSAVIYFLSSIAIIPATTQRPLLWPGGQ